MNLRRFTAILLARNREFYRDRAAFGWNFLFPFLIILGFSLMFERGGQTPYKVGLVAGEGRAGPCEAVPPEIAAVDLFEIVRVDDLRAGLEKLGRHRFDLLVTCAPPPRAYWISETSPKGRIAESLLLSALADPRDTSRQAQRRTIQGRQVDYIDWLFPGIIAMNAMFSALFGVGWVVVRYRKAGVLKRFKATPLTPLEYLSAQVVSRMMVLLLTNFIVYAGCALLFGFRCAGSYLELALFFTLGCASLISLGLIVAARSSSEEFANGVLNFVAWPMMFLSEVWFSLEGAPQWIRTFSRFLPLTHVTDGMRRILTEGAGLADLAAPIAILTLMTLVFMGIGSALFKWTD